MKHYGSPKVIVTDGLASDGAGMHASIHNHFNLDRHLSSRSSFTFHRDTAIQDWRKLIAA